MKKLLYGLLLLICIPACELAGPDDPLDEMPSVLLSAQIIERVTVGEIATLGLPLDPEYDVDLLQVVYSTPGTDGETTTASGLLALPVGRPDEAPLISYQHGTEVRKDGVASVGGMAVGETVVAVVFAATGYVAAMPDYLGLGISPGLHPYVHASSLASATVDMLRASREVARDRGVDLSGQVILTGYSEGGSATAAAQRLIEEEHSREFRLIASAPMAGAYDMSGIMVDVMRSTDPYPQPYYLPFLLLAYNSVYGLYEDPADMFVSPYSETLPSLFDGTAGAGEINSAMPSVPIEIVDPSFLQAFDDSETHPLRVALEENDLYDWTPATPTRLYHCVDDELIPFENSQRTYDRFVERGAANVSLMPLDFGGHAECVAPALLLAKYWFDELLAADAG